MKRFRYNEMNMKRVREAVRRRLRDLPHAFAWSRYSGISKFNRSCLENYKNKHLGQRCFIMGNGPSLANMDLTPLKNEITFGLNRIYLLFNKMPFIPTYYLSVNQLVLEQFASEISALSMPKFLTWNRRNSFDEYDPNTNFLRLGLALRDKFNHKIDRKFYSGGTVTYVAIQLAYIMGFAEIILIGVDHSFADKGVPNKTEVRTAEKDVNHFHPDYFPKGVKWQLPDLRRSEIAYSIAREEIEKDGRTILDATENGNLNVFEKVEFSDLFHNE
jgi:hypothetical protein